MAYTVHYGTEATTGNSTFRVILYTQPTYNASNYTVQYYYEIQVTKGNFQGSVLTCSWGNVSVTLNGTGTAYKSSVMSATVNYGAVKSFSIYAQYTGGSGTVYKSSLSYTGYPTMKIYDGSAWKNAIPWVYDGSTWKRAMPMVYNGSKWASGELT